MWRRWVTARDRDARERLILHFSPLVTAVVASCLSRVPRHVERADLTAAGTLGLIDAFDRFEPDRGVPFAGYATHRIRGAVLDELRHDDWLPRSVRSAARGARQATDRLRSVLHREPTEREVAAEAGLGVGLVRVVTATPVIVATPTEETFGSAAGTAAPLSGDAGRDPAWLFDRAETARLLSEAIHRLDGRQQVAVALYYFEGMQVAKIGRVLGLSDSRVSQLLKAARGVLHDLLVINGVGPRCTLTA